MAISQVALAGPAKSPAVHTVDCTESGASVKVTLKQGHYVIISDGDGFSMRIDGPGNETIELAAGRYEAEYVSDDSHSFGGWNASPPDWPHLWGIRVYRVDR